MLERTDEFSVSKLRTIKITPQGLYMAPTLDSKHDSVGKCVRVNTDTPTPTHIQHKTHVKVSVVKSKLNYRLLGGLS